MDLKKISNLRTKKTSLRKPFAKVNFQPIKNFFNKYIRKFKIKDKVQRFKNRLNRMPRQRRQLTIILIIITTILILFSCGIFLKNYIQKARLVTVGKIELNLYYSRGSRDEEKIEKEEFTVNDPIQLEMIYNKAEENTVLLYKIQKESGESLQEIEIPVSGNGNRFVTIASSGNFLTQGRYKVQIEQAGYILAKIEFEVK